MQKYGHTPVVLLGGGTGMVGDPSGRQDMRQMMSVETIDNNCNAFKKLFDQFLDFDDEWKYEGNEGVYAPGHQNLSLIHICCRLNCVLQVRAFVFTLKAVH